MTEPLLTRIEDLERAIDDRATSTLFARCYAVLTTLLIVLTLIPVDDDDMIVWHVRSAPSSVENLLTVFVLTLVPLLFLLLCLTVRPGRSPWPSSCVTVLACISLGLWLIIISNRRVDTDPAGYALMLDLLAIATLALTHAIHSTRPRFRSPQTNTRSTEPIT
jgi:hypothetical protein